MLEISWQNLLFVYSFREHLPQITKLPSSANLQICTQNGLVPFGCIGNETLSTLLRHAYDIASSSELMRRVDKVSLPAQRSEARPF